MTSGRGGSGFPRLFVVAGEHSGDRLGAGLMDALRERAPEARIEGVGGDAMAERGLSSLFPLAEIAVMGVVPVVARLPSLLRRIRETAAAAVAARPDALVVIDSPDFTHRVARRLRAVAPAVPVIDYVSPTVWAWRPGRARRMAAYVDHVLALLPFEPAAHRRLGGPPCTYVGHPLVERLADLRPGAEEARAREAPTLLVLPGSRRSEIRRLLPVFGAAVGLAARGAAGLDVVLPAVDDLADEIRAGVATWPVRPRVVTGAGAKFAAFRSARAALAASGTVTLELALSGVPMAVAYKVAPIESLVRHLVSVDTMVLPNLVLGEKAFPEFFQEACTPAALAAALRPLIDDTPERRRQVGAFARVDAAVRLPAGETPSGRAADLVLSYARRGRTVAP